MDRLPEYAARQDLHYYISLAEEGKKTSVDRIMSDLNENMTLAESKFIDFALGLVETPEGTDTIKDYLFNGTQIQRNYCALYFNRRDEWPIVKEAYEKGLIDATQAFSR